MKALYYLDHKSDTLAPHRYSLVLRKVGCAINCAEWLPVSKDFFDECSEGCMLELTVRKLDMTPAEAFRYYVAHKPIEPPRFVKACIPGQGCEAADPNAP